MLLSTSTTGPARTGSKRIAIIFLLSLISIGLFSQQKVKVSINDDWLFVKGNEQSPEDVNWTGDEAHVINLPHTWNDKDAIDEEPGYYRGGGWYRKTIGLENGWEEKRIFLEFEAANQQTDIFINGKSVGSHIGGYSAFRFDISEQLETGENEFELCVKVDNSFDENIPPLTADFTFFGGIYRDAWLIYAPEIHFSLDHFGGPGVFWQTPDVNRKKAIVKIFGYVSNYGAGDALYRIEHILIDGCGKMVEKTKFTQSFAHRQDQEIKAVQFNVKSPALWSPDSPNTYTLHSRIIDIQSGELIDEESNIIGFRWFEFDADKGFFLNGDHLKLRGISMHQDYPGKGNSLDAQQHLEDVLAIKNMGANFLRIAHYPQDQDVIFSCDTAGLITSVEIPIVNRITETQEFTDNCLLMMEEMIWQNYNHPGLIMWTYMNEVLLRPPLFTDTVNETTYYTNVRLLAEKLEQTVRTLDPYRATMIPNHGAMSKYIDAGLTQIPMVVGWNLYQGWYGSGFSGFEKYIDQHHDILPDKPLIISEYGAGHDPRLISPDPKRFDFTAEYAMKYHKHYKEEIEKRDFVAGSVIWILNDFCSEERGDAVPNINSKGICSVDRQPKESYWYYKSQWYAKPFVKIWTPFPGVLLPTNQGEGHGEVARIRIYTNADSIRLELNGTDLGVYFANAGLVEAILPSPHFTNRLKARVSGSNTEDQVTFSYLKNISSIEQSVERFEMHISCGDHRYFWDDAKAQLWLPDQQYTPGSWGYVGGKAFTAKTRHGVKPSADQAIQNTLIDPVFQTQRVAPSEYRFDLPSGNYEITLLFSELDSPAEAANLAYNLGDDRISQEIQVREFAVLLNEDKVMDSFNMLKTYGPSKAIEMKFKTEVNDDGLHIHFKEIEGDPTISGIAIQGLDNISTAWKY